LSFRPFGGVFDRRFPRVRIQGTCNNTVFDMGCGLVRSAWKFIATVSVPGAPGWPFVFGLTGLDRVTGSDPTYTENWFAGGWIEVGGDRIRIRSSTLPSGGVFSVQLARDPSPFVNVGDAVVLYPGCDGLFGTCTDKFSNRNNFLGHPLMPRANPSLIKLGGSFAGGKK
jgi:uncharacterized phage protein (TIGR02218 family)